MRSGGTIKGPVIEVVKGGLILDIGLRGFLPASLVDLRRVRDLHPFVGQELEAKIIELDRNRNNVVLSRRAFLEESQSEGRKKFLESLQKGERRKGTVTSIVNFGAFVDLGGVDGLVHVSELSWKHVDHPSEVVAGRPGGRGRGARRRPGARARVALAQGDAGGPLEGVRAPVLGRRDHRRRRSPSSCRSARSSGWPRASRVSSTSPRSATSTSTPPSPCSPSVTRARQGDRGRRPAAADQPVDPSGRRRDARARHGDRRGGGSRAARSRRRRPSLHGCPRGARPPLRPRRAQAADAEAAVAPAGDVTDGGAESGAATAASAEAVAVRPKPPTAGRRRRRRQAAEAEAAPAEAGARGGRASGR